MVESCDSPGDDADDDDGPEPVEDVQPPGVLGTLAPGEVDFVLVSGRGGQPK